MGSSAKLRRISRPADAKCLVITEAIARGYRRRGAIGGLVLSASHNPGGPEEDFGIKYNVANGGPAPEKVTDGILARTLTIDRWLTVDADDIDLDTDGIVTVGEMPVEVVDPVEDYAALMETLFDFDAIRAMIAGHVTEELWRCDNYPVLRYPGDGSGGSPAGEGERPPADPDKPKKPRNRRHGRPR